MARVKRGVTKHARHKKILKLSEGYVGRSGTAYRPALGTPASRVAHSAAQVAQLPRSKVNCTLLCAVLCREARRPSQISTTV